MPSGARRSSTGRCAQKVPLVLNVGEAGVKAMAPDDKFGLGTISTAEEDMKNLIYENNDGKHVPEGIGDAVRG